MIRSGLAVVVSIALAGTSPALGQAGATPATSDGLCARMLDEGDHAFSSHDYSSAQRAWRSSIASCALPGLDPLLRSRSLLRQASLPEFASDEGRLLDEAVRRLDRENLDHAALLAELLRRRALFRIGAGDFQAADRDFTLGIDLLSAAHGAESAVVAMATIERENQRILDSARRGDEPSIESSIRSLESMLDRERAVAGNDKGVEIAIHSALVEGYRSLNRLGKMQASEEELNRLLH